MSSKHQITRNIGLYHVARELSVFGWNVILTTRNAKGADLYACSGDERTIHPIQVKTQSGKPEDTSLGLQPESLVTPWWVFVVQARTADICCYLLSLDQVRSNMTRDPGTRSLKPEGERIWWLDRRFSTPGSDREITGAKSAWELLGVPRSL